MTEQQIKNADEEFAFQIQMLRQSDDHEANHETADGIIIELLFALGFVKVVKEWKELTKWYG